MISRPRRRTRHNGQKSGKSSAYSGKHVKAPTADGATRGQSNLARCGGSELPSVLELPLRVHSMRTRGESSAGMGGLTRKCLLCRPHDAACRQPDRRNCDFTSDLIVIGTYVFLE